MEEKVEIITTGTLLIFYFLILKIMKLNLSISNNFFLSLLNLKSLRFGNKKAIIVSEKNDTLLIHYISKGWKTLHNDEELLFYISYVGGKYVKINGNYGYENLYKCKKILNKNYSKILFSGNK